MTEKHTIMGGKVHVYRRSNSGKWQCSTFLEGKNHRLSTGTESLSQAKEFAEDWYLSMRLKQKEGKLKREPTFRDAAEKYIKEYDAITANTRNQHYLKGNYRRLRKYLIPFFGDLGVSEVTNAKISEYVTLRRSGEGKKPAPQTLHQELVTLRQALKRALAAEWITQLPSFSRPSDKQVKISRRGWFSGPEYKKLYEATRRRAEDQKGKRWEHEAAQLHDFVLFMGNTGLRPDEANRLQYRDVEIAEDQETGETILIIEVRGKRGVGYCKSMPNAVHPFERLVARNKPKGEDLLFPGSRREMFNAVLTETGLKHDRDGKPRTAYSLRHTYISLRLEDGANIYQIAKNCRTSVEMIEKFYASHIQNSISAAAVNVTRKKLTKKKEQDLQIRNAHRLV